MLMDTLDSIATATSSNASSQSPGGRRALVESVASAQTLSFLRMLQSFTDSVASDMVVGQPDLKVIKNQFRVSSTASFAVSAIDNITMTTPVSSFEALVGGSMRSQVVVTGSTSSGSSSLSASLISLKASLFAGKQFETSPLILLTDSAYCSPPDCSVDVTLPNNSPINFKSLNDSRNRTVTFETKCKYGQISETSFDCPGGPVKVRCNGTASMIKTTCGNSRSKILCNSLNATGNSFATCDLLLSAADFTVCPCRLKYRNVQASLRRLSDSATKGSKTSVDVTSMITYSFENSVNTWMQVDDLSLSSVQSNMQITITLGVLVATFLLGAILGYSVDAKRKLKVKANKVDENIFEKSFRNRHENRRVYAGGRLGAGLHPLLQKVENNLPSVMRSEGFYESLCSEMKRYHR